MLSICNDELNKLSSKLFQDLPLFSPENDHRSAVQRHSNQLTEFQSKMVEACQKYESLEEEHIAQMVTFVIKLAQVASSLLK